MSKALFLTAQALLQILALGFQRSQLLIQACALTRCLLPCGLVLGQASLQLLHQYALFLSRELIATATPQAGKNVLYHTAGSGRLNTGEQVAQQAHRLLPNGNHANPFTMMKRKVGVLRLKGLERPKYLATRLTAGNARHHDDPVFREPRQPAVQQVIHAVVICADVQQQQVDAPLIKLLNGACRRRIHPVRDGRIVLGGQRFRLLLLPSVGSGAFCHQIAVSAQPQAADRLA